MQTQPDSPWRLTLVQNRFTWLAKEIRPADISERLRRVMLAKDNLIEDASYRKIVPNRFLIELNEANYIRNFQPISGRIIQQWREALLEALITANNRQGRREFSFAGRVEIEIQPAADLAANQARVYSKLEGSKAAGGGIGSASGVLQACLELLPGGQRWRLHTGIVTLGRDAANDIFFDLPAVQDLRLVSAQHAYIRCDGFEIRLFDGSPNGRASTNGTFVNSAPVPPDGVALQEGDLLILAAQDRSYPRLDTPGGVVLRFHLECNA